MDQAQPISIERRGLNQAATHCPLMGVDNVDQGRQANEGIEEKPKPMRSIRGTTIGSS